MLHRLNRVTRQYIKSHKVVLQAVQGPLYYRFINTEIGEVMAAGCRLVLPLAVCHPLEDIYERDNTTDSEH